MTQANSTGSRPLYFILLGIPGLESFYLYIAFVFFMVYVTSVIGNVALLFIIKIDRSLHGPMYLFLCMLSFTDLVLTSSTTPKMLSILWFNFHQIYYEACLTQMVFLHSFAIIESAILLAMAFDRYVAICYPLRYTTILTKCLITSIGLLAVVRAATLMVPLPFLIKRLPFCAANVIHHSYCKHMAVVKLSCADTTFNNIYGIVVALFIVGLDLMFIIWSYILIIHAVFQLSSREAQMKALGTCASHIGAILVFYVPVVLSSVVHRFGKNVPIHIHILLANVYLMLPPLINPIIYGVKTRQIRTRVGKLLRPKSMSFKGPSNFSCFCCNFPPRQN
ncbi:olfactory receptor 52K1-like [Spea bombifrons]|uniref:olfactory receptor 52K1-like n=1 Tax=Spea bombifrons TaxID=233779 RepID=UPI00234BA28C|nr:olfactory receptor 52K1-like [Spea bombifrons]